MLSSRDCTDEVPYKKGVNVELDRELERYKKMRLQRGNAINEVFTDDEFDTFGQLWQKERQGSRELSVSDVSKLLEFAKRIRTYRAVAEKETCRKRVGRARKKLRKAAKDGDSEAVLKLKRVKKSAKKRAAKSFERKRGKNIVQVVTKINFKYFL